MIGNKLKNMKYRTDIEIDLTTQASAKYIISSLHRRKGNPNKSIWKITYKDELDCFIQAINSNWKNIYVAWGIKIVNNKLQVVGINPSNNVIKLAKFVDGAKSNVWHGYPADHVKNAHDRPETFILKNWALNGYISKSNMVKIRRGQVCNL